MAGQPVVVGVDASPEGALAGTIGWRVAQQAKVSCHLVHVMREPSHLGLGARNAEEGGRITRQLLQAERQTIEESLAGQVPPQALEYLEVRMGNPAWVLAQAVSDRAAGLLVLGGKHHAAPVRWFGGSTVHHTVRTVDVPLLVTTPGALTFSRVLVAVDLSDAAQETLEGALTFAAPFGAEIRVLHVVEPLPSIPDVGIQLDEGEHLRLAEVATTELATGQGLDTSLEQVVRCGAPARTVAEEAAQWEADLVVVGSHGKGWVDRVLLGSTTERLLNRLPCSVLVIPIRAPTPT
ncbi:MAG: universal stress protein [Gemmatimonadales bacterium]|jgi:nucleotide-binding universal stress UspA family protein